MKRFLNPSKIIKDPKEIFRYAKYLTATSLDEKFLFLMSDFRKGSKKKVLSNNFLNSLSGMQNINEFLKSYLNVQISDKLNRIMYLDTKVSLPDDMLMKLDKMTMAHSIESRAPLLDHEFAEFCSTIPMRLKINGNISKFILRKTLTGKVPEVIVNKRKTGLTMPKVAWLDAAKEIIPQILSEESIKKRGYFNNNILKIVRNYNKNSQKVWSLLMLEIWHRVFIDSEKPQKVNSIDKLL